MESRTSTQSAEERRMQLRKVIRQSVTFVVICGFLSILNKFTCPYPWSLWVVGAWGMGIVLQWMYYLLDC